MPHFINFIMTFAINQELKTKTNIIMNNDFEFRFTTSDLINMSGKAHFITELILMKCDSGTAEIAVDMRKHTLSKGHSFILLEGVVFQLMATSKDFGVTYCTVSLPFYHELATGMDAMIFNVLLYSAPDLYNLDELKAADLIFESLKIIYENNNHHSRRIMAMNLIACYIYEMYDLTLPSAAESAKKEKNNSYNHVINAFYGLIIENGYENRSIEFYAEKLNMSSRYLYKIVQNGLRVTPKQLIDDVVVSLIKQLLLIGEINNQQIADRFNFPDQSSFGQYFRRCTGMSPSNFRNMHR